MAQLKIKSTHPESQGDYVLIDEEDFNPDQHVLYVEGEGEAEPAAPRRGNNTKTKD